MTDSTPHKLFTWRNALVGGGLAADDNVHVRRLVSEGTRPRLPWAARLPRFLEDPTQ